MFKYETSGYRFLAWTSVIAMGLRAAALLAFVVSMALYFLFPGVSRDTAVNISITALAADFVSLAYLFFTSFATKFFRKRTVLAFIGAAALLLGALVLCIVLAVVESSSVSLLLEILIFLVIAAYLVVPGWLSCKDVSELFKKLSEENKNRELSVAERIRSAKK